MKLSVILGIRRAVLMLIFSLVLIVDASAQGLFKSSSGSICEQAGSAGLEPLRETIIYLDKELLSRNELAWFGEINQVLQQTMTSAEPLELVVVDSKAGSVKAYGETLCYPFLEKKYHERFRTSGIKSLLTNDLIDELPELEKEFERDMQRQIMPAFDDVPDTLPIRGVDEMESRHLLYALQSDASRFSGDLPKRVLIYSDMVENSDVANFQAILDADNRDEMVELAWESHEKLPRLDFQGAMVYVFGVGGSLDDPAAIEPLSTFWRQIIYMANGHPVELSQELSVRPIRPANTYRYDVTTHFPSRELIGKMQLLTEEGGRITDSFISMGVKGRSSHFVDGRMICNENDVCQMEARLATAVAFEGEEAETLYMEGSRNSLDGHIGFRNDRLADSENPALLSISAAARR